MAEPMFYAEPLDSACFLPCLAVFFNGTHGTVVKRKEPQIWDLVLPEVEFWNLIRRRFRIFWSYKSSPLLGQKSVRHERRRKHLGCTSCHGCLGWKVSGTTKFGEKSISTNLRSIRVVPLTVQMGCLLHFDEFIFGDQAPLFCFWNERNISCQRALILQELLVRIQGFEVLTLQVYMIFS